MGPGALDVVFSAFSPDLVLAVVLGVSTLSNLDSDEILSFIGVFDLSDDLEKAESIFWDEKFKPRHKKKKRGSGRQSLACFCFCFQTEFAGAGVAVTLCEAEHVSTDRCAVYPHQSW